MLSPMNNHITLASNIKPNLALYNCRSVFVLLFDIHFGPLTPPIEYVYIIISHIFELCG